MEHTPDPASLRRDFEQAGQGHVFAYFDTLGERAQRRLLRQLAQVDLASLPLLSAAIEATRHPVARNLAPAEVFALADENYPYAPAVAAQAVAPLGEKALRDGRVGALLVAGGQGTRLGFDGPKGCYPVLPSGMTLFEVFARKLLRVGREYGRTPPLYVMVGGHNETATRNFWADHEYFGLKADDVKFFAQGELPALDDMGKLVLEAPDRLFMGPDGHGGVLRALHARGMLADMAARGVQLLSYFQVDNLQTPVADAPFLGLHLAEGAEVSLKVVRKHEPSEKVGIFCLDDGVPGIVEYTEFSPQQAAERGPDGRLRYWAGSIAVHAFGVDFLRRLAESGTDLPLHAAHKKVPYVGQSGETVNPDAPNAWKFERFVFDTIPLANKVMCLEVPRDEQFLPLKNPDGPHGPDGLRRSYVEYWGRAFDAAGKPRPEPMEIDPGQFENARELLASLR